MCGVGAFNHAWMGTKGILSISLCECESVNLRIRGSMNQQIRESVNLRIRVLKTSMDENGNGQLEGVPTVHPPMN